MGIVSKQSTWNLSYILLGFTIGGISRIFLLPHMLEPSELGSIDLMVNHAILFATILNFGGAQSIVKFFKEFEGKGEHKSLTFTLTIIPLILSLIVGLVLLIFPEAYAGLVEESTQDFIIAAMPIIVMILMSQTVGYSLTGLSNSLLRSNLPVFMSEVFIRISVISGVVLYYSDVFEYRTLLYWYGFVYVAYLSILLFSVRKNFAFSLISKTADRVRIWNYAFFTTLDSAANKLVARLDILMIGALLPAEYAAYYLIGLFVAQVITIPTRAIAPIATPLIAEAWTNDDMEEIKSIYHKSSLNQMILAGGAFLMIWASVENIQQLLPPEFRHIKYVVLWLGTGALLNLSFGLNSNILNTSSRYRVNFYLNLMLLVLTTTTNLLLIPEYGIEGAALATFISLLVFNILKFLFIWKEWKIQPFRRGHVMTLLLMGAMWFVLPFLPEVKDHFVVSLALKSAITGTVFGILVYALGLSPDINQKVKSLFKFLR